VYSITANPSVPSAVLPLYRHAIRADRERTPLFGLDERRLAVPRHRRLLSKSKNLAGQENTATRSTQQLRAWIHHGRPTPFSGERKVEGPASTPKSLGQ
jgi:hypothetical protein